MCECQALHPEPEDEESDDYDGEEYDVEAHGQQQGFYKSVSVCVSF